MTVSPLEGANVSKNFEIRGAFFLEKVVQIVREAMFADRDLHDL
jgi:hypothetical protein